MGFTALFLHFLLIISCTNVVVKPLSVESIREDIANFDKTCDQDNCTSYDIESLSSRGCHCGIQCVQLGTCCIDSYYVDIPQPELKPACRSVYNGDNYFIVDKCPSESAWASLCNTEWNEEDDVQKLVPVTSLLTFITYKNYYCLRCLETSAEFLYWTVSIEIDFDEDESFASYSEQLDRNLSLTYSQDEGTWMAIFNQDIGYIPVKLSIKVPYELDKLTHLCEPDVISDCSEKCLDEEIRSKCQSYMALKEVKRNDFSTSMYKNTHCALCNFESLNDIQCIEGKVVAFGAKIPFSFTHLLDINRSNGELVGRDQKCSEDHIWDPYTKKCRKLTCAVPGFEVQNGKCVQK